MQLLEKKSTTSTKHFPRNLIPLAYISGTAPYISNTSLLFSKNQPGMSDVVPMTNFASLFFYSPVTQQKLCLQGLIFCSTEDQRMLEMTKQLSESPKQYINT